ncbi:multicomponent Na+:H+ antiporter subunit A [Nocardiopsis metallicus]|uniref:Multicomponent Na+:H+ antiporter subunit A n=1 Tax=Nocardiopsis metallicus TaxID=179819 RepID=A0A840WDN9_9ACTN|nr:multicomponent Na+:H+ antiporter subunit A [Nocardiopsis metallicus]
MLLLLLIVLAVTVASTPLLDRFLGRNAGWPIAAVFLALTVMVALQAPQVLGAGVPLEYTQPWMPRLGVDLHLRMDGLGWMFTMLVTGIGALIMAYSTRYFPSGRRLGFYFLMSLFAFAMAGLVLADDVVLLFVFWEITTIASFYLIGLSGPSASRPAIRTFLLTAMGGLALLGAVVLLVVRTGTTQLSVILSDTAWTQDTAFVSVVALLVIVAVFSKSAQFPFHYWLPDAMAASTPVSAYLHAAAMVKAGIYLAMRFTPAFGDLFLWNVLLISAGLITAVMGAFFALQQNDLKRLAAFSTVSQLGLLVAVIGVGTPQALVAASVHTVAHALFKSALFMVVGLVDIQTGTRDIRKLGGLRRRMPVTALIAALAALSMSGIPPLLGFISKESLFESFLHAPGPAWFGPLAGVLAVSASVLTFAYSFRFVYRTFFGASRSEEGTKEATAGEARGSFWAPAIVASLGGVLLGLTVPILDPLVNEVAANTTHVTSDAHLVLWHGFNAALVMSMAAIGLGALVASRSRAGDALAGRDFVPVSGVGVFESLYSGIIRLGKRTGDLTRTDSPAFHLGAPTVLIVALAAVAVIFGVDLPPAAGQTSFGLDWLLVGLMAAAVLAAVITRSRMAGLALVGVAGFTVALWLLFLGAFDVALTQFLVEILTVVVAVLVLRRLPKKFHPVKSGRKALTAVIAVAAGLSAGIAAFALTGRRELSPAAEYFLENAPADTGGTNVVNTILVDYRALDTFGELVVLGVAGLIIIAVLHSSGLLPVHGSRRVVVPSSNAAFSAEDNTVLMRTVGRYLMPLLVLWSLYLLFRGHNEPGGGFIAGLVGGSAFALLYLAAPSDKRAKIRLAYPAIIASGVLIAAFSGFLGYADGSFLRPLHAEIPLAWGGYFHFTTAFVFDIGVYLGVVGVLLTALNELGLDRGSPQNGEAENAGADPEKGRDSETDRDTTVLDDSTTGGKR